MVDREHPSLSIVRQCALLGVSRSSLSTVPGLSRQNLSLMGEMDRQSGDPLLRVETARPGWGGGGYM